MVRVIWTAGLARELKRRRSADFGVPILMLTAKARPARKIKGL